MRRLYGFVMLLVEKLLPLSRGLSPKMKKFVDGRKTVFTDLQKNRKPNERYIWLHAASLGEFEQGVPVLESLKQTYPQHRIAVSFFSPSGYEIKKNTPLADLVCYLPIDTIANARQFIDLLKPELVLFVKYEIWPNLLKVIKEAQIPSILISAVFRKDQIYFKPHGKWMQQAFNTFSAIFVQDEQSKKLAETLTNVPVILAGDTRYDRVQQQISQNNQLPFLDDFSANSECLVAGSTWPEDENALIPFINENQQAIKFIIAPHEINADKIDKLQQRINAPSVRYSERHDKNLSDYRVFILDTIGLLSKAYAYAQVAYVGGAMGKTGLHNILEPATFGLPILIGKNHRGFPEATALKEQGGLTDCSSRELQHQLGILFNDKALRKNMGKNSRTFVENQLGSTQKIIRFLTEHSLITG